MDRGVENLETINRRCSSQGVRVEELRLGLSSVSSLSVPPLRSIAVQNMAAVARYNNVLARDREERTRPLLIFPSGFSLENDLFESISQNSFFFLPA